MGLMKRMAENRGNWANRSNRPVVQPWPLDVTIEGDAGLTQRIERQMDAEAVKKFNRDVRAWGQSVTQQLKASVPLHVDEDKRLSASIKQNYRHFGKTVQAGQEITSIGFSFVEEGVFVHLGVGRGYNMQGGTRIITKKHNRDEWRRHPKPWFNPVIEKNIASLAEIVKNYCGDLFINTSRIYINR